MTRVQLPSISEGKFYALVPAENGRKEVPLSGVFEAKPNHLLSFRAEKAVPVESLKSLTALPVLHEVDLSRGEATDKGVAVLSSCCTLQSVTLDGCAKVTDAGLESLGRVGSLTALSVSGCSETTDAGVGKLSGLKNLTALNLSQCPKVTDGCIPTLTAMSRLASLDVRGTGVTPEGIEKIAKALPKCQIAK